MKDILSAYIFSKWKKRKKSGGKGRNRLRWGEEEEKVKKFF